jgi:hypothetical protein
MTLDQTGHPFTKTKGDPLEDDIRDTICNGFDVHVAAARTIAKREVAYDVVPRETGKASAVELGAQKSAVADTPLSPLQTLTFQPYPLVVVLQPPPPA